MQFLVHRASAMESTASSGPPDGSEPPESYRTNSKKEQLLLSYAENFTIQFKKLYGDRKPLLLRPLNECGVEKFVCTTLRPTCLHYKELHDWDGSAAFMADYITYQPLSPPDELPKELSSPTLILKCQEGNSFNQACLLCSLLLGVGYDAYCVCGYAVREVTELDQRSKTCPLLQEREEMKEDAVEKKLSRYMVRPPRNLSSHFERRQEAKARAEEERKRKEEEKANAPAEEEPPADQYHGLRIHCWVLVLSGKREVAQSFFIEPTTGESHPLDSEDYLGIESLWNHKNYWVNMQDCAQGIKNMTFDLGDATRWEFFFPSVDKPLLVVPEDSYAALGEEPKPDNKDDFELPPSWVLPIHISRKDFETQCPQGKRTTLYHKSQLDKYAEYLNSDGLVMRLTLYSDTPRKSKVETKSYYKHREDRLEQRVEHAGMATVCESFGPGRPRALREHTFSSIHSASRTMLFYSYARVDGLSKRELTATEMAEHYEGRADFLYHRLTTYAKPVRRAPQQQQQQQQRREIVSIVEKFNHNPAVAPNTDVAQRLFQLSETRIRVTYHLEPNRITASYRQFLTPPRGGEQAYNLTFDPKATSGYQVDPYAPEPKSQHLFQQLEALMAAQEDVIAQVRASEDEVAGILGRRKEEEANPVLAVSVYDVVRNQKAFQQREEEEQRTREEERLLREKERDYLAPFLERISGGSDALSRDQAREVIEECLRDQRQRLVEQANIIQARFDSETEALSRKQAWYKANQGSLTRDSEADYIAYCNEALFRIHILEQRLNTHKRLAPEKYLQLERRLREDPRLRHQL